MKRSKEESNLELNHSVKKPKVGIQSKDIAIQKQSNETASRSIYTPSTSTIEMTPQSPVKGVTESTKAGTPKKKKSPVKGVVEEHSVTEKAPVIKKKSPVKGALEKEIASEKVPVGKKKSPVKDVLESGATEEAEPVPQKKKNAYFQHLNRQGPVAPGSKPFPVGQPNCLQVLYIAHIRTLLI